MLLLESASKLLKRENGFPIAPGKTHRRSLLGGKPSPCSVFSGREPGWIPIFQTERKNVLDILSHSRSIAMAPFRKDLITVVELPVYKIGFADLRSRLFGDLPAGGRQ